MKISMGIFTIYALMVGLPMVLIGGRLFGLFIGRKETRIAEEDIPEEVEAATEKQPSGFLSFFVLLLPIVLILFGSIMALILENGTGAYNFFPFIGNKNIALFISVIVASIMLNKFVVRPMSQIVVEAAEESGLILLITGAGGAFGYVINNSGIGSYLVETLSSWNISMVVTGFILSPCYEVRWDLQQ